MYKIRLDYLSSVVYRVLPSVSYSLKYFNDLRFNNKRLIRYFSNVRTLIEYPGLYNFFKSRGFDMTTADIVKHDIPGSKETFLRNVGDALERVTRNSAFTGLCGLTQEHIDFIFYRLSKDIFPSETSLDVQARSRDSQPSFDDVLNSVNLKASQGFPDPYLKKRDILPVLEAVLNRFYSGELKSSEIFKFPAMVFVRAQIRGSGLKMRVVHAVQATQQIIESFYYIWFKSLLTLTSCIIIGFTQIEVSKLVSKYTDLYCMSVDAEKWDLCRPPVFSVIAFEFVRQSLALSWYQDRMFIALRNQYLTLPSFHPAFQFSKRLLGTVSGSSFTTMDNSLSGKALFCAVIFEYCKRKGVDPYTFEFISDHSGDDIISGFKKPVDHALLFKIASDLYGITLKLECDISKPGDTRCFFLGSEWIAAKPFRKERLMVASVIFGSGNFPKMSLQELLQSRFIEVFGNSSDMDKYWRKLRVNQLDRLFFFNELHRPFKSGDEIFSERFKNLNQYTLTKDSRGFWFDKPLLSLEAIDRKSVV